MKTSHHLLAAGLLLAINLPLHAQLLDPAVRLAMSQASMHAPQRDGDRAEAMVSVYIKCNASDTDWEAIRELGGQVGVLVRDLATVRLPQSQLGALAQVKGVGYVQAAQEVHLMLDLARQDASVDEANAYRPEGTEEVTPYTGRGIVIGQVDGGLDYRHNAFRTADGTLRIKRVWEQNTNPDIVNFAEVHSPVAFGYGSEFDSPELILMAGGDTNAGSHGTHVMGIAAGSDTYLDGQFHGVAPEAELVMVSLAENDFDNVCASDAIKYIFDYADSVHKPCVINLSLGSHKGPHDGTSPFDQIVDELQGPGRLIVGASGNYGLDKFHISRNFGEMTDNHTPFTTIISHKFYSEYVYGDVDIWADNGLNFSLDFFDYNTSTKAESDLSSLSFAELLDGTVHTVSFGRNVTGYMQLTGEVNPLNGKTHILLRSYLTNQRKNHAVAMRVTPQGGYGQIDLWADDKKLFFDHEADGFTTHTDESTIIEIGGTAKRILTVGAYTTRDQFQLEGEDTWHPVGMELHNLMTYSGFGPTADGRQKPEVCAPGSFIVSSCSGFDLTEIYMHSHYTDAEGHPQRYGYLQGTSMSAPFVTGAVALWLQAYPQLTPEELKEVVASTSRTDDFTSDERLWGAGKVNVLEGLKHCIELNKSNAIHTLTEPLDEPIVTYDAAGRRVTSQPTQGLYIIKAGTRTRKVCIR